MANGTRDQLPWMDARIESVKLASRTVMKRVDPITELVRAEPAGAPLIDLIGEQLEFGGELTLPRDAGEFPQSAAFLATKGIAIHVAS
jgi:hypothetical protein